MCGLVYRAYSVWTSVQSLQCGPTVYTVASGGLNYKLSEVKMFVAIIIPNAG